MKDIFAEATIEVKPVDIFADATVSDPSKPNDIFAEAQTTEIDALQDTSDKTLPESITQNQKDAESVIPKTGNMIADTASLMSNLMKSTGLGQLFELGKKLDGYLLEKEQQLKEGKLKTGKMSIPGVGVVAGEVNIPGETVVPGSPIKTVLKSAPAVIGQAIIPLARDLIPKDAVQLTAMILLPEGQAYLDELLSVGGQAIARTAPNTTAQMLRSMMEVTDPQLKAALLKKAAPALLGRNAAQSALGLPEGKLGTNEIDPVVEGVLSDASKNAGELFSKSLSTFSDRDFDLLGGKKLVSQIKKLTSKFQEDPGAMNELITNFTPAQQRMITRRGLGIISELPAEVSKYPKDFVDKHLSILNQPGKVTPELLDQVQSDIVGAHLDKTLEQVVTTGHSQPQVDLDKVEKALSTRMPRSNPLQQLGEFAKEAVDGLRSIFEFEPRIKKYPQLRYALERGQSYPIAASRESVSIVGSILEPLSTKEEYETFRKFVILQDWKEELEAGHKVVSNISLSEVNEVLASISSKSTPSVAIAAERHYKLVQAMGEDLVRRGYISPEMLKDKYFRHNIIKYMDENLVVDKIATSSNFRTYVLPRSGGVAAIDTDYIKVMHRLIAKVKIDNFMDDVIHQEASRLDIKGTLPDEMRLNLFGPSGTPKPGKMYNIEGQNYVGFRYSPRNTIYKSESPVDKIIADAVEDTMSWEDAEIVATQMNPALPVSQHQKTYLIPEDAKDSLTRFAQQQKLSHLFKLIKNPTNLWKRVTLTTAGVPWQFANFVGGMEALYREGDYTALANLPQAVYKMVKSDKADILLKKAVEENLMFSNVAVLPTQSPELFKFLDFPDKFKQVASAPLKLFDFVSNISQNAPKFAKFMADTARIQRGEAVLTKTFAPELKGLTDAQQVIKLAKLTVVDMSANSPIFNNFFKDSMFPFASFFYHNTKGWAKYTMRNPQDMMVRFAGVYAGMQYWNWKNYPEVEKTLPEWRRYAPHIITGWKAEDGTHIVTTFSSTAQMAAKWIAADKLVYRTSEIARGELSMQDAVDAQIKDMTSAPREMGRSMINPVVNAMIGIATNEKKKEEGGGPVVPDRLKGTTQGVKLQQEYLLNNLVTPLSAYLRTERKMDATPVNPIARFLKFGPFDFTRAAGIYKADIAKGERIIRFNNSQDAKVLNNQNYADLENAYVEGRVTGDFEKYTDLLQTNPGKIPFPSGKSLNTYLKSLRIELLIHREKFKRSNDPVERQQLIDQIKQLEEGQSLQAVKKAPKQERAFILGQ